MSLKIGRPKIKSDISGFTIVEMLVAFSIFAILVVVVTPVFRQGSGFWQTTQGQVELGQNLNSALEFLSRELRQAEPGTILPYNNSAEPDGGWNRQVVTYNVDGEQRGISLSPVKTTARNVDQDSAQNSAPNAARNTADDQLQPKSLDFIRGGEEVAITSSTVDIVTAEVVYQEPVYNIKITGRYLPHGAVHPDSRELTVETSVAPRAGR